MLQRRQAAVKKAEFFVLELPLLDQIKDTAQKGQGQGRVPQEGQDDVHRQPEAPQPRGHRAVGGRQKQIPGDHQRGQGRGQGPQDLDGKAPVQEKKRGHQGPGRDHEGLPEGGHRQVAPGPGEVNQLQGMATQAHPQQPDASPAEILPLGQEKPQPEAGGGKVGDESEID